MQSITLTGASSIMLLLLPARAPAAAVVHHPQHHRMNVLLQEAAATAQEVRTAPSSELPPEERVLSNPLIPCFPLDFPPYSHACNNFESPIFLDDALPPLRPIHACVTDTVTSPTSRVTGACASFCTLVSSIPGIDGTSRACSTCAWLESGDFAYDCTNLFPDAACPARDFNGVCQPYSHWTCLQGATTGDGFGCFVGNPGRNNPALRYDPVPNEQIQTTLLCSNDIGGLDATECEDPICNIFPRMVDTAIETTRCAECRFVRPSNSSSEIDEDEDESPSSADPSAPEPPLFTYDCATTFPDLTCPVLFANGTCQNETLGRVIGKRNTTYFNVPSFLLSPRRRSGSSFLQEENQAVIEGDGWTLTQIDPTTFNVLIDIYDKLVMVLFGIAVATLFPVFYSWQVRKGKEIPVHQLGHVPGDFWTALQAFRFSWQLSAMGVALLVLVIAADFAHSLADLGLDFVIVGERADNDTVFVLGSFPEQRNPFQPMETYGDPVNDRTFVTNLKLERGDIEASRPETALTGAYLDAVGQIVRADSPFTKRNRTSWRNVVDYAPQHFIQKYAAGEDDDDLQEVTSRAAEEGEDSTKDLLFWYFYVDDGSALVALDQEVPLECYDIEMAQFERIVRGNEVYESPIEMTAWVPNCTLTAERPTGIYRGRDSSSSLPYHESAAQILETMESFGGLYIDDRGANVRLLKGNESFVTFEASPASKQLTRDRIDWTQGREFYDVDGLQIGKENNSLTIPFASVFVASGAARADLLLDLDFEAQTADDTPTPRNEYMLVAEVEEGECPPRPSGHSVNEVNEEQCLVTILLECNSFPEDTALRVHPIYAPQREFSRCDLSQIGIVWGRNFLADRKLAATVAGLFGMVRPSLFQNTLRVFNQNGILAALFAMGLVDQLPAIKENVRPRVGVTFLSFIFFPLCLAVLLLILAVWARRNSLPIPMDTWEFLVMGAEDPHLIPTRTCKGDKFPAPDDDLVFTGDFFDDKGCHPTVLRKSSHLPSKSSTSSSNYP